MGRPLPTGPSLTAAMLSPTSLRGLFGSVVSLGDLAAHDLAVERERLKHDVQALAVLVREHKAQIEPEVVLTFAPDDRICPVRRSGRLLAQSGPCVPAQ